MSLDERGFFTDTEFLAVRLERLEEIITTHHDLKTNLLHIRQILESIYRKLCESENISFSGLFSRMQCVHNKFGFPAELVTQINQLRLLCNRVTHEESFQPDETSYCNALYAIGQLLSYLNPSQSSSTLTEYLQHHQATPFPAFVPSEKHSFLCVVTDFRVITENGSASGLELCVLDDEGCENLVILNNGEGEGRAWSRLAKIVWLYCTIQFHDLSRISGRERCFMNNPQTIVVIEPDFLIDSSSLAECFTNSEARPEFFILNRLVRDASSEKPLQGMMVNSILDDLILNPTSDFQELFRTGLAKQAISYASIGKDVAINIFNNIKSAYFPRLQEFAESLQGDLVHLEPSYICYNYGLQGRLDVLYQRNGKYHILELKSGAPPGFDVWKPHQMQVVAYNLIIRNCYSRSKLGFSSIYYPAAEANPLRHVVNTTQLEMDLMMCRNRIVGILHSLAVDPRIFFGWLSEADFSHDAGFLQNKASIVQSTLKSLKDYELEWFTGQVKMLANEIWNEKTGGLGIDSIHGHNSLWRDSRREKMERYRALDNLSISALQNNILNLTMQTEAPVTDFRSGDIVIVYRQQLRIDKQEILRGQIIRIDAESITVRIRGGLPKLYPDYQDKLWAMEHDILETSLYNPLSSLFAFLLAPQEVRNIILGIKEQQYLSDCVDETDAVRRIENSSRFHIVQGPPGTGKTSGLLTTYIHRLYNDAGKRVLILSFTNRAVDEICLNLRKKELPFIRTGQSDAIDAELLENRVKGKKLDEIVSLIKSCRILVSTVQSCNSWILDIIKLISFDELVIDEASQILENSLAGIISQFPKVVFVGDQNQLPPISRMNLQRFEYEHPLLQKLQYNSYNQSMMERLSRICRVNGWNGSMTMLHLHYRMHEEIADLIQSYYDNGLVSCISRQSAKLPSFSNPLIGNRLVWIECPPSSTAYFDSLQIECIAQIIDTFGQNGLLTDQESDLGIVIPFRAMIHELRSSLPETLQSISIDTVERFQGSERRNIILALPLHNSDSLARIEALNQDGSVDRKLNVALSRAQDRIVILGNAALCSRSPHYKLVLDKIRASGKMLNYQDII